MNPPNILLLYSLENNDPISKKEISLSIASEWLSLDDLKKGFSINCSKIKYFDDYGDLISLINFEDFLVFKELLSEKRFPKDRVVVIGYKGTFDKHKFGHVDNVLELKIENESPVASVVYIKSNRSVHNSISVNDNIDYDSSSSSSLAVQKRMPKTERNKRFKHVTRYAAKLKKELNYLPGSEVSDGQTIIKKWRIKNVGSKKWKENTIKSVLLPSTYSNWISYFPVVVPICFADQKVEIEMEILINGQWDDSDSSVNEGSRDISLTWLLFTDSLVTNMSDNFKDYILTQLELCITVKRKSHDTGYPVNITRNNLKKHLSESSIERVDKDFSIVNMSEEEDKCIDGNDAKDYCCASDSDKIVVANHTEDIMIELPDCPYGDDFQITDFINPDSYISVESEKPTKTTVDNNSILSLLKQSDYVGKISSTYTDLDPTETGEAAKLDFLSRHINVRVSTSTNEDDILVLTNTDEHFDSKEMEQAPKLTNDNELQGSTNVQEIPVSIIDNDNDEYQHSDVVQEIPVCNDGDNIERISLRENEEQATDDGRVEFDGISNCNDSLVDTSNNERNQDQFVESEDELRRIRNTNQAIVDTVQDPINNQSTENLNTSRQPLIDSIKNDFPRTNADPVTTTPHLPFYPFPCINQPTNYVAGVGRPNCMFNAHHQPTRHQLYNYQPAHNIFYQRPAVPYHYPIQNNFSDIRTPSAPQQNQVWQNNGDEVLQNLRRQGHLHGHINESNTIQRAENGQHFLTSQNLEKLQFMGFLDEGKNRRLLMKFNNNINDVINDLID